MFEGGNIITFDTLVQIDNAPKSYSCWQKLSDGFVPAVDLEVVKVLPSGCYKLELDNKIGDYKATSFKFNSDEAFRFSESYTEQILNEVQTFWDKEDLYKKHNLIHKRGFLLEGPAGTGKSVTITLLIEDLLKKDGIVFIVNTLKDLRILVDAMPTVITKIEKDRHIITVIEDVDKLIEANSGDDSFILDFLDGKSSPNHHLVIMTSNNTTDLSPAMLRPSRVDLRFVIPLPNEQIRREYLSRKGIASDKLDEYVGKTDGLSLAQLKEVFVGTAILDKDIDKLIQTIKNPLEVKDYLNGNKTKFEL